MRSFFLASVAVAMAASFPAAAQINQFAGVTQLARDAYANCRSLTARDGIADARTACACVVGYMGGLFSDRDFEIAVTLLRIGEMTENGSSEASIEAEIMAFYERGFTESEVQRVAAAVEAVGARGDAVCGSLDAQGSV